MTTEVVSWLRWGSHEMELEAADLIESLEARVKALEAEALGLHDAIDALKDAQINGKTGAHLQAESDLQASREEVARLKVEVLEFAEWEFARYGNAHAPFG